MEYLLIIVQAIGIYIIAVQVGKQFAKSVARNIRK